MSWRFVFAGFKRGPKKLKIVGTPRDLRISLRDFSDSWKNGANKKQRFFSRKFFSISEMSEEIFTPNSEKISAEPDLDEIALLPCLATGTPAAATIKQTAVEIFNVFNLSPPVPQTSIAPAGAEICFMRFFKAAIAPMKALVGRFSLFNSSRKFLTSFSEVFPSIISSKIFSKF